MATKTKTSKLKQRLGQLNPLIMVKKLALNIKAGIVAIGRFFQASYAELRTVSWLSRKDTLKFSGFILLFVVLGSIVIALIDLGFFKLIGFITTTS